MSTNLLFKVLGEAREQGIEQGIAQGIEEGVARARRQAIIRVLEHRFTTVPDALTERLAQVTDQARLDSLLIAAVDVPSPREFAAFLD
jgi:flagellar biosynthesis/type III secretory pathway protein FliH